MSFIPAAPTNPSTAAIVPIRCWGCLGVFSFGGLRVDAAVVRELIRAVEPMAIEAAMAAERMHMESQGEHVAFWSSNLQQARYEASLAERRYAACDPENRLIAAQLEKSWEATLQPRTRLHGATGSGAGAGA